MKYLMALMSAAAVVAVASCREAQEQRIRYWGELPLAYDFAAPVEKGLDLSREDVVRRLFEEELERDQLKAIERPFFMRAAFHSEGSGKYYTWVCRVPESGVLELWLESAVSSQ